MADHLRVLIDARMLLGRFSGVARMVTRIVENMVALPKVRVIALCGNRPYEPWARRNDLEMIVSDFSREHRSPVRRLWWESTRLRYWIARAGADVYHATWNTGVPFRCPVPSILTVHDLIPWDDPAPTFSMRFTRACYRYSLSTSVRRARHVATVSGFTADQIAQRISVDPTQIRIIHNGVEESKLIAATRPGPERPYLLYVGGHEPRKNLEGVLGAVEQYWLQHDSALELHVTGSVHQLSPAAKHVYEHLDGDGRIQFLGSPDDEELAREYAGATALLMLSRAEGFGLPVLEAMIHGCPVIAARCGALPEIVGDAGLLVDPEIAVQIVESIHKITSQPAQAAALIAEGRRRAENFTWKRAAEAYFREYQLAASKMSASAKLKLAFAP